MKYIEKIKEMLCTELEVYSKKNAITPTDLEKIHKLTDTVKNLDKILLLEEDEYEMGGSSYARGRGRNAKRDRMGRYSSNEGDMSYEHHRGNSYDDDMSYARGGRGRKYSRDDGYSNASDDMMGMLGEMMEDASPKEREALKECMRALERM